MKQIVILFGILIIATSHTYGQFPDLSDPNYNQTVPNLLRMQYNEISYNVSPIILTLTDFQNISNKEYIDVYVVYTMDSKVGKNTTSKDYVTVPKKLMDMYMIYDYSYLIYYSAKEGISDKLPQFSVKPEYSIKKITGENIFLKKGEIKERKIKNSSIGTDLIDSTLKIQLDESNLIDNSYVKINIQIKSRNFLKINPSYSPLTEFSSILTLSYPTIFIYETPIIAGLEQLSDSTGSFNLLHFYKDPGVGNGHISLVDVGSKIRSWRIIRKPDQNFKRIEFILDKISIPPNLDIGIDPVEFVRIEE